MTAAYIDRLVCVVLEAPGDSHDVWVNVVGEDASGTPQVFAIRAPALFQVVDAVTSSLVDVVCQKGKPGVHIEVML